MSLGIHSVDVLSPGCNQIDQKAKNQTFMIIRDKTMRKGYGNKQISFVCPLVPCTLQTHGDKNNNNISKDSFLRIVAVLRDRERKRSLYETQMERNRYIVLFDPVRTWREQMKRQGLEELL